MIDFMLNTTELHDKVVRALEDDYVVTDAGSASSKPFEFYISRRSDERQGLHLYVYIWNTHKGGQNRPEDEYRVQLSTPSNTLTFVPASATLLMGWSDEFGVFTAWDAYLHRKFRTHDSVQVKQDSLERASRNGLDVFHKQHRGSGDKDEEAVISFRPEFFRLYLEERTDLHGLPSEEDSRIAQVLCGAEESKTGESPLEHRLRVTRAIEGFARNRRFTRDVLKAYDGKCALCGLGLVTEAAHIVPHASEGSVDSVQNGVALCPSHHRALDKGLLVLNEDYTVGWKENLSNEELAALEPLVKITAGKLRVPGSVRNRPSPDFIAEAKELRAK